MDHKDFALQNAVYSVVAGSHSFGLAVESSDEDFKGAFMMTPQITLGLESFEEFREEPMHFVSLRKWGRMLADSKPNYVEFMFVEDRLVKTLEPCFKPFLDNRKRYLTKKFVEEFIDMSKGLSKRSHKLQENALSDQVALQGKQSQHALRIIRTLEAFRETGEFKLNLPQNREELLSVRFGKRDLLDVDREVVEKAAELDAWNLSSDLPDAVEHSWMNEMVYNAATQYWRDKQWP